MTLGKSRHGERGATLLLMTSMVTLLVIPLVGLAIDCTMCYIVQSKLSAAADAAALGSGRLLGTTANIPQIAGEFLKANYPNNYWGSKNLQTQVNVDHTLSTHTITVTASVEVPLMFLRVMGYRAATPSVTAVSTRRDTRVELVLDRSASMAPNIGALRTAATTFVKRFTPGVDDLGLVMYGGSAFVAYPTTKTLSTTGPNRFFADPPAAGQNNLLTMISSMDDGSNTGTAEALYLAWQELKTAHALANDPTRLNAIVLFTDGVPNGFAAYFNDPAGPSIKSSSSCNHKMATVPSTEMKAWMASTCSNCSGLEFFNPSRSAGVGIFVPVTRDTAHNAKWWTSNPGSLSNHTGDFVLLSGTPVSGCSHLDDRDLADLSQIPPQDLYGTSTRGTAWTNSLLYQTFNTAFNPNEPLNGYQVALASWNAVDNVAKRILGDTSMSIAIYCIGYTGNGGVDATLLKRVANTLDSASHNINWQTGLYVPAGDEMALQNAFNTVASEILRLSR